MEVMEDGKASEQVMKLRAGLALVSGQIEVSQSMQPIEITYYAC